jgi:hypothetical protein
MKLSQDYLEANHWVNLYEFIKPEDIHENSHLQRSRTGFFHALVDSFIHPATGSQGLAPQK